jgi:hypothetical protein
VEDGETDLGKLLLGEVLLVFFSGFPLVAVLAAEPVVHNERML